MNSYRQTASVLGDLRVTYGGRTPRRLLVVTWIATPLLLAGAAALTFLLTTDTDNAAPGDLAAAVVIDAVLFAIGIALPIIAWVQRGKFMRVFEQGIEFTHRSRVVPIRWDEIQRVFFTNIMVSVNGIPTGAQATCRLEGDTFGRIRLTHWFDGVAAFGEQVQQMIHARLLDQASASWRRGVPLSFGPLTVSPDGVGIRSKRLAWSEVEDFIIDGGWVTVRAQGKMLPWASLSRAKVPNALVLRAIARSAMGR